MEHGNYLPHLSVVKPKLDSKHVTAPGWWTFALRSACQRTRRLPKNLASVIRIKGDVAKIYNGEVVEREYAFLQCFLWQDLDFAAEPTMHQVVVNNISAKPAGCIATLSLYKSLDLHKQQYPERQLKESSYLGFRYDAGFSALYR